MKTQSSSAITFRTSLVALLFFSFAQNLYAGEKKTVICNNKFGPILQRLALPITDRAGHEIGTQNRQDQSACSAADWDGSTVTINGQFDWVKGSGEVWGYAVRTFKDGDKVFTKYKASLKRTGEGDQWQTRGQGSAEVIGGTGKFANISGANTFTVQISPAGGMATETLEIDF